MGVSADACVHFDVCIETVSVRSFSDNFILHFAVIDLMKAQE